MDATHFALKIPFSDDLKNYMKEHVFRAYTPDELALFFLLAELTNTEPDVIRLRYEALRKEVRRVAYGI